MASLQYDDGKSHGSQEAKAMFKHDDKEERMKNNHSNPNIDKSLTHLNFDITGMSYPEICARYDKRIAELDATTNTNIRSDRVTCFGIEIPTPKDLPEDQYKPWFNRCAQILSDFYGKQNFLDMKVHFDEIHTYIDARTKQEVESRVHGTARFIPEHNGKLDGKWFSSRKNIMKMNRAVDQMTRKEFGVRFLDGTQRKSGKTVEELKQESRAAAVEAQTEQKLQELDDLRAVVDAQKALRDDLQAQVTQYPQDLQRRLERLETAIQGVEDTDRETWMKNHTFPQKQKDGTVKKVTIEEIYQQDRQRALEQAQREQQAAESRLREVAQAQTQKAQKEEQEERKKSPQISRPMPIGAPSRAAEESTSMMQRLINEQLGG